MKRAARRWSRRSKDAARPWTRWSSSTSATIRRPVRRPSSRSRCTSSIRPMSSSSSSTRRWTTSRSMIAPTAQTGVARMRSDDKPFDDPKVRKAFRLATDCKPVLEIAHKGLGEVGEHHHVCDDPSGLLQASGDEARRRSCEEALGRGRLSERHRYRDRLQARTHLGAGRGRDDGRAVEGSRHQRQDQRPALGQVLG